LPFATAATPSKGEEKDEDEDEDEGRKTATNARLLADSYRL
jgi:hypothetical protein